MGIVMFEAYCYYGLKYGRKEHFIYNAHFGTFKVQELVG